MSTQRRTRLFLTLAWVVIALQVLQFFVVDHRYSPRNWAIYRYSSDDVIEIALREDPNPRSRYSAWVAIAEIAPHSTVYLPVSGTDTATDRLYGFARVSQAVVIPATDPSYPADAEPPGIVVASGPGAHRGPPWVLALDPDSEPGGDPDAPTDFLPDALADGNRGSNPGPPREFVVLRWQVPPPAGERAAEHYSYHRLIVETSALTPQQRQQYGLDVVDGADS